MFKASFSTSTFALSIFMDNSDASELQNATNVIPLLDEDLSWKLERWSLNHVNWISTCLFVNCHIKILFTWFRLQLSNFQDRAHLLTNFKALLEPNF